jgi:hypothetical protein
MTRYRFAMVAGIAAVLTSISPVIRADDNDFTTINPVASTVPLNGDVNPYGVAVVPANRGNLIKGNVLVSNFNNGGNLQGTGSTIVQISPRGSVSLFAQISAASLPGPCPGGVGLTTALVVLRSGWVIVGSLPTTNGMAATAQAGCLIVLDSSGKVVETLSNSMINGPWDMTARDDGDDAELFVTNVLNGTVAAGGNVVNTATVLRIVLDVSRKTAPTVDSMTVIGSGFSARTDPAALVIGPTGVGLGLGDVLYVADTLVNRIAAIPNAVRRQTSAGTGITVTEGGSLNGPLGLAIGPLDTIATVNSNDGNLVFTTPFGRQFFTKQLDNSGNPPGAGALFGLAFGDDGLYFVDDATNMLNILQGNSSH